jgi:hypothetical protein
VGSPGIFGHIATDGAGCLAGRIRHVIQSERKHRLGKPGVHHPGLKHSAAGNRIDTEDPVQSGQGDENGIRIGQGASGESGPRSPGHERDPEQMQQPHDLPHLRGTSRHDHHARERLVGRKAIHGVRGQLGAPVTYPFRADDAGEGVQQRLVH